MATDTPTVPATPSIRISKVGGRYLLFDAAAALRLRREHNMCGNAVGIVPQQPTQNVVNGMPIELRPEEVDSLIRRKAAHVVDDTAAHQAALISGDRSAYTGSLQKQKQAADRVLAEMRTQKAMVADRLRGANASHQRRTEQQGDTSEGATFESPSESTLKPTSVDTQNAEFTGVTPTASGELISREIDAEFAVNQIPGGALARFLQRSGYYMTPGLRFGAMYSVYPGDPLRFHAHFMANEYGWDEDLPILDIVEGGRLATAVKKALLIGGEAPPSNSPAAGDGGSSTRTYSIEWAAM